MKKKYLVTTVAMLAAVSMLTACGSKNENNETPTATPTVTVAPTEAPSGDTTEPTLAPTEAPSGDTVEPTVAPEAAVDHAQMIQNVAQALKETYGAMYLPDMQMQADEY